MNILVLNAGSSSLKFRLMRMEESAETVLADGLVEKWGTPQAALRLRIEGKEAEQRSVAAQSPNQAAEHAIRACLPMGIDAAGHRVVHGGWHYSQPTRIDAQVIENIREVSHLAPLHNALALAGIEAAGRVIPSVPAFAVFDTAFHRTIPDVAALYAIPAQWAAQHHLRRYGFHGISHEYVSQRLLECIGRKAPGTRLITCHLGNGCSVCAIRDGKSIDTSMGLTPMEGLVMGTRSGDIDPGLMLHLLDSGMNAKGLDDLLNRRSGLLGLSGRSGDMRDIEEAARNHDPAAELTLQIFAYRVRKYIGAYAAALGGLDGLAFAGGIGEHSNDARRRVCEGLEFLSLVLDQAANDATLGDQPACISTPQSQVPIWVLPTDEEKQIARQVVKTMACEGSP